MDIDRPTAARGSTESLGRSASMRMEAVNQQTKAASTGNLQRDRAAPAMHAAPVQTLQQGTELGGGHAHHAVLDAWPLEAARLQLLGIRHRPVPSHQTSLIRSAHLARTT